MGCGSSKASTALTPRGQAPIKTPRDPVYTAQKNHKNAEINNNISGSKSSIRALRAAKISSANSRDSGVEEMSGGGSPNPDDASLQGSPKVQSAGASNIRARQKILRIDGTQHSSSVGSVRSIDQEAVNEIIGAMNKSSVSSEEEKLTLPATIPPIKGNSAGTIHSNSDDSAVGMDDDIENSVADNTNATEPGLEVSMRPKTRAGNLAFDLTFDDMMPDTSNKKKAQLVKLERRKSKRKKKKTLKEIQSDLAVAEERRKELEEQKAQKAVKTRVTCSITQIEQFQQEPDTPREQQDPNAEPSPEDIINGTSDFYESNLKNTVKHSPPLPHKPVVDHDVDDDDDRLESVPLATQSDSEEW